MEADNAHDILIENVEKTFPGHAQPAVSRLNTRIQRGGVTGLVGPDGAGKTTLLRMLAGLLRPDSGSLRVAGRDPLTQPDELHAILGYMPQKFGLYEDLTVQENLSLYAELRGIPPDKQPAIFEQLLTFTDLTHFTGRLAGKLSGGMKQKLGLACTLVGQPHVLLLDEPGVGVDPLSRRELWRMVHELAEQGMLILWSTSYLDEAEQCREILLMNEGRLLYGGPPQQLTQRMAGRSVLLHGRQHSNRQLLQKVIHSSYVSDAVLQGKYVRLILRQNVELNALLTQLQLPDAEVMQAQPRFEDAFIDLLGGGPEHESGLSRLLPQIAINRDETVIEACQLTKKFNHFAAADCVNFQVKRGEIYGLLGPNGAGKSTTFKMMCGLLAPTSGQALVLGSDLKTGSVLTRQRLGYMAQKFSLYGNLTVLQNLKFFSGAYGLRGKKQQKKIDDTIAAFNFSPILHQEPDQLPLGFKQRLALACALMHEPDILFLDEPTSGVDPLTRREFWLHINGMVEKGVTVMVTTHFMEEAEYCDRIGLVYRGKIIASGSPDELKHGTANEETPNPTMEHVFFALIQNYDKKETAS